MATSRNFTNLQIENLKIQASHPEIKQLQLHFSASLYFERTNLVTLSHYPSTALFFLTTYLSHQDIPSSTFIELRTSASALPRPLAFTFKCNTSFGGSVTTSVAGSSCTSPTSIPKASQRRTYRYRIVPDNRGGGVTA